MLENKKAKPKRTRIQLESSVAVDMLEMLEVRWDGRHHMRRHVSFDCSLVMPERRREKLNGRMRTESARIEQKIEAPFGKWKENEIRNEGIST
jgi:hypothetical protein